MRDIASPILWEWLSLIMIWAPEIYRKSRNSVSWQMSLLLQVSQKKQPNMKTVLTWDISSLMLSEIVKIRKCPACNNEAWLRRVLKWRELRCISLVLSEHLGSGIVIIFWLDCILSVAFVGKHVLCLISGTKKYLQRFYPWDVPLLYQNDTMLLLKPIFTKVKQPLISHICLHIGCFYQYWVFALESRTIKQQLTLENDLWASYILQHKKDVTACLF